MDKLLQALELYGLEIVFVGVLLDQGGLPLPSFSLVINGDSYGIIEASR